MVYFKRLKRPYIVNFEVAFQLTLASMVLRVKAKLPCP